MDALRDFAQNRRCSGVHTGLHQTCKMFYDRYPVKVEVNAGALVGDANASACADASRVALDRTIMHLGLAGRVQVRRRDCFATIYLQDEDDALALCHSLSDVISAITCPRNAQELSTLLGDGTRVKPVMRTSLYWGKYTYGLSLKASARKDEMYNEIREWIEMFKEMNEPDSVYSDNGAPPRVYFKREEDVAYFKLVFHEQISNFEKAILIEDISDASGSVAAVC